MNAEIAEKLEELKNKKPADTNSTLWIDAEIYIQHVEFLLKQVEEANRKSDQWELEYYRK